MVHPHVCGEKNAFASDKNRPLGSSPRVWGKVTVNAPHLPLPRFIPTCVGKRSYSFWGVFPLTVHPHVCGEKSSCVLVHSPQFGSSPRVWGKGGRTVKEHQAARFIPTCVGKRRVGGIIADQYRVHPHVCGEKIGRDAVRHIYHRFIPTCVGKSHESLLVTFAFKVHPHVCGEKHPSRVNIIAGSGSSPRLWGKDTSIAREKGASRFIPTCVGKSTGGERLHFCSVVHPHVCGEKL